MVTRIQFEFVSGETNIPEYYKPNSNTVLLILGDSDSIMRSINPWCLAGR